MAGGVIRYEFAAEGFEVAKQELVDWIERSAFVVANYYGRFPVERLALVLVPVPGSGVKTGKAYGVEPPTINVFIGLRSTRGDLKDDWIMVHEMVHLAFPTMPSRHHWLEEGLATYVESIARANVGDLTAGFIWKGFVRGMPYGLPGPDDRGLDYTPTWGRTYWGGALYCLMADIELRERTNNRLGLQDALSAIVRSGANITRRMRITETLEIGDEAVGLPVLTNLYHRMKATAVDVDLDALWRRLGVTLRGDEIVLDDRAPLASVRERITAVTYSSLNRTP